MPKRVHETPLTVKTKSGVILSPEQARFCVEYIQKLGNGVEAALIAYDIDKKKKAWYATANSIAQDNLQKPSILEYIREIYNDKGLNDEIVDAETSFLVKQSADKHAKAKGIDIYNKLNKRYDNTVNLKFAGVSNEELAKTLANEISGIIGNGTGNEEEGT